MSLITKNMYNIKEDLQKKMSTNIYLCPHLCRIVGTILACINVIVKNVICETMNYNGSH